MLQSELNVTEHMELELLPLVFKYNRGNNYLNFFINLMIKTFELVLISTTSTFLLIR